MQTCPAGQLEPESDIADLTIVCGVDTLEPEEVQKGLSQIREETRRQWERGNLLYMAADVQSSQLWFPERFPTCIVKH